MRYAWDLLLTDRYTLAEICEKLYERGYRLKNGKPFVTVKANGERDPYVQQLSRVFHNWHYAGWVVIENDWANIPPKTVRSEWEPVVSTEEFEQGLAILAKRSHMPTPNKRYFYLLQGLVYLQQEDGKTRKLSCGTTNANRARGGVSYYCVPSSNQNYLCWKVDEQIPEHLQAIQVDPELIPEIRKVYLADMSRYTNNRQREAQTLQNAIKRLEDQGTKFAGQRGMSIDEASKLLIPKKYIEGHAEALMQLFVGADRMERELRGDGKLIVYNPPLSLIGATTPTMQAGRLIDGKLWDGETPIRFDDVYAMAKKMKCLTDKDFSLFALEDFGQSG